MQLSEAFEAVMCLKGRSNHEVKRSDGTQLLASFRPDEMTVWDDRREISKSIPIIELSVRDDGLQVRAVMRLIFEPLSHIRVVSVKTFDDIPVLNTIGDYDAVTRYGESLVFDIARHYIKSTTDYEMLANRKKAEAEGRIKAFLAKREGGSH